jgi:hypothetical protein
MKKLIIPALILALILSGCGFTDQLRTVKDEYIDPAVERAQSGELGQEAADTSASAPNIATNRERLSEYQSFEAVYTRADGSLISALVPSSGYGRLLPFAGGLVTEQGEIVLDTVCSVISTAFYEGDSGPVGLDIYILGNDEGLFAVCAADGSWCTGFEFSGVLPMELGVLCVEELESNRAVCYAEDGSLVFDTASFGELYNIQAGSIESLARCGSGLMQIIYVNGQKGFISADGTVLNRANERASFFEDALPFSNGLAAVKNNGVWGYINTEGEYVIDPAFEEAGSFVGSLAAVKSNGVWCVIDKSGEVKREFPDVTGVNITLSSVEAGGKYYTTSLEEAVFYEYTGIPCDDGFWVRGANGVRLFRNDGSQVYFSGGVELLGSSGELWLIELADGSTAVMDAYSRVVAAGSCSFVTDFATGDTYIFEAGSGRLYDSAGHFIASGCTGTVIDGFMLCEDGDSVGWKAAGDTWVFRVALTAAD